MQKVELAVNSPCAGRSPGEVTSQEAEAVSLMVFTEAVLAVQVRLLVILKGQDSFLSSCKVVQVAASVTVLEEVVEVLEAVSKRWGPRPRLGPMDVEETQPIIPNLPVAWRLLRPLSKITSRLFQIEHISYVPVSTLCQKTG